MDNSRICHRLLFHEHGKQYFVQPFLRSIKLLRLHTCTLSLNFTLELWGEFLMLMSVDYAWTLPEANSTTVRDLYCLWAACPCQSWSTVAMRALSWVVFVPRASLTPTLCSGSSPSQWLIQELWRRGGCLLESKTHWKFLFMKCIIIWKALFLSKNLSKIAKARGFVTPWLIGVLALYGVDIPVNIDSICE